MAVGSKKRWDRNELLAQADRMRQRGRLRRAITLYQSVLEREPGDLAVQGKIAPLLAAEGRKEEAMAAFRAASAGHAAAGFADRGIAVLRQAADCYPEDESLWVELAELHLKRGRRGDAVAVLVAAGERLLESRFRAIGAKVLRRALELEPWHARGTLLLARTLAGERRKPEAVALLEGLGRRTGGAARAEAWKLAFWYGPTPRRLWRWLARSKKVED